MTFGISALFNTGALLNPFIRSVHYIFEILIFDDALRHIMAYARYFGLEHVKNVRL
jgi:hypothetical protein